jgi:hypothetical protein
LDIVNPIATAAFGQGFTDLNTAQGTPEGRARIALSQALMDVPGWEDPTMPAPDRYDYAAQEVAQYLYATNNWGLLGLLRAEAAG